MKNLFVQGYPGYPHSQEANCPPHLAHEKKGTAVLQLKKWLKEQANPFKDLSLLWRATNLCLCPLNQECQNWDQKSLAFVKL